MGLVSIGFVVIGFLLLVKDIFEGIHEKQYMGRRGAPLQATCYGACYRLHVANPLPITRESITDYTWFCCRLHVDNFG